MVYLESHSTGQDLRFMQVTQKMQNKQAFSKNAMLGSLLRLTV